LGGAAISCHCRLEHLENHCTEREGGGVHQMGTATLDDLAKGFLFFPQGIKKVAQAGK
jgi:hypothetical protein